MYHLRTPVLSSDGGQMGMIGQWLQRGEEPFSVTKDMRGQSARITGAAPYRLDDLREDLLCVTIERREKIPIIGLARCRVHGYDPENPLRRWVRLDELRVGDAVLVPCGSATDSNAILIAPVPGLGLGVGVSRVRKIQKAPPPSVLWPGTPAILGTLVLGRGRYAFASAGAFLHV